MCRCAEPISSRHSREVLDVLCLAGGLPQVVVVVSRQVVHDGVEGRTAVAEGQPGKAAEHLRRGLVRRERQVEDVARHHEGGRPHLILREPAQAFDKARQERARGPVVHGETGAHRGGRLLDQRSEDTVLGTEVKVGDYDPADFSHGRSPGSAIRPTSVAASSCRARPTPASTSAADPAAATPARRPGGRPRS